MTPCRRQWVYAVQLTALKAMPAWVASVAVKGMGKTTGRVWLWPVDARHLAGMDRNAGGRPQITRSELRHCPLCARPFVGIEAEIRRKLDESGPLGRETPCSGSCERDAQTRVWKKLAAGGNR